MNDLEWAARNVHKWPTLPHDYECKMIYVDHEMDAGWGRQYPTDPIDGSEITKNQWLSERARLQNKPKEWEGGWIFQDRYGWWHSFDDSETPKICRIKDSDHYCTSNGLFKTYSQGEVLGDWRDTLEKKPEHYTMYELYVNGEKYMFTDAPEKKQEWKQGELPPVGTVCEVRETITQFSAFAKWSECAILAVNIGRQKDKQFIIKDHNGDAAILYEVDGIEFRPLKTKEEKAVEEMYRDATSDDLCGDEMDDQDVLSLCQVLYRHGYRKP